MIRSRGRRGTRALIALLALALGSVSLGACSDDETSDSGLRVINFSMTENAYDPNDVTVAVGETVILRFKNNGTVRHEAVVGDEATQLANEQQMQALVSSTTTQPAVSQAHGRSAMRHAHPGMTAPNLVSVEPGETGEITFTFAKAGTLIIGCHEPGHYDAGMVATITIAP